MDIAEQRVSRLSPRLILITFIIIAAVIIIAVASNAEKTSYINWSLAVSHGVASVVSFGCVLISLMVVRDKRAFLPAAIGFSLLFLGFLADLVDEFVQPPMFFMFFEKLGLFAGMLLASMGIYSWARTVRAFQIDVDGLIEARMQKIRGMQAELTDKYTAMEQTREKIGHRTMSNFQLIESMLRVQMRSTGSTQERDLLIKLYNRVNSIAMIHSLLEQSDPLHTKCQLYFSNLAAGVIGTFEIDPNRIQCVSKVADISLSSDTCVLCGMIANELVTNALLHAFQQKERGSITISLSGSNGGYTLAVADNGVGLPEDIDIPQAESMGFRFVNAWVKQLKGAITVTREEGTTIRISFRDGETQ